MSPDSGSPPSPDDHSAAETRVGPGEEGDDGSSARDRWRNHKTTVLTAAGTALVLAGCALAMSTIIDSASVSFGSRQPAGGQVSLTAPPSQGDGSAPPPAREKTPPTGSTAPQPSASSGPESPSQDDEDDREDSHDDEDDEDDEDDDG
ncbi:hypothetical protein [Streptomyces sp. BRA346]|uniref:hypothetical protein n=1 Tax=Streptomyces sp. BRA346 TaxID=2878199 RepID=UPI004064576B